MKRLNFFRELDRRIFTLKKKYGENEVKILVRLGFWSFREFFKTLFKQISHKIKKLKKTHSQDDRLRIAISVSGGAGDILMFGLAVKELSKHIGCDHTINMSVMNPKQVSDLRPIFREFPFISFSQNVESYEAYSDELHCDVLLRMDRCTIPLYCNDRMKRKSPWLAEFYAQSKEFCIKYHIFFENVPRNHIYLEQWSIVNGVTRVQQSDQCKLLGIDYSTSTFLAIDSNALDVLESLNLTNSRYITLQTGIHQYWGTFHSTKIWLPRHYAKFVQLFHEAYPGIKIIQLGSSKNLCASIPGVDLNLIGETTLDEVAAILKHSLFHLDGDCGMVHMKRFLNGRSIVLFGTTSANLFGYPENINITGLGCNSWCEWVTDDWDKKCLRGFEEAPCMASITPEMVMEAAHKIIDSLKEYSYETIDCNIWEEAIADFIKGRFGNKSTIVADVFNKNGWDLACELRENFDDITMFRLDCKFDSFSKAKDLGLKLEYGCLYNISMADDSCDVVIWQNGDESEMEVKYILKELFRILKPGGALLISGVAMDNDILAPFGLKNTLDKVQAFTKQVIKV
ncbi:MAG: hypothetical protein LBF94_01545 [Puniceicoccales bacterium]|jgi:hypothetical protein|nr:hypothetical protein [Puniceicoccales bacterium]